MSLLPIKLNEPTRKTFVRDTGEENEIAQFITVCSA
jgi:hypothetical protein